MTRCRTAWEAQSQECGRLRGQESAGALGEPSGLHILCLWHNLEPLSLGSPLEGTLVTSLLLLPRAFLVRKGPPCRKEKRPRGDGGGPGMEVAGSEHRASCGTGGQGLAGLCDLPKLCYPQGGDARTPSFALLSTLRGHPLGVRVCPFPHSAWISCPLVSCRSARLRWLSWSERCPVN